jgi:hypothetical protein
VLYHFFELGAVFLKPSKPPFFFALILYLPNNVRKRFRITLSPQYFASGQSQPFKDIACVNSQLKYFLCLSW